MTTTAAKKAIPTIFEGVLYRSRVEARWAKYFKLAGIVAHWEFQGFRLPSGCYLPDFRLPCIGWAEVKADTFTEIERRKCAELAEVTGEPVIMLDGPPALKIFEFFYRDTKTGEAFLGDYEFPANVAAVEAARSERFGR